jgi:YVTN family beta-propeller protein
MALASGPGGARWQVVLVAALVAVLLIPSAANLAAGVHGGTAALPIGPRAPPSLPGTREAMTEPPSEGPHPDLTPPTVQNTVVLFNGSLVGGNFQAGWASEPVAVTLDPVTDDIFVADQFPAQLSIVGIVSGFGTEVIGNVTLPSAPGGLVYDPVDGTVYVTETGMDTVAAVNGTTLTIDAQIPVGSSPAGIAYDSNNSDLYVANSGSHNVSVIDGATNQTVAKIDVGIFGANTPVGIAYDAATDQMFVADSRWALHTSMPVAVINDSTNTRDMHVRIIVGDEPVALTYDSNDAEMFVANEGSNNLSAVSDSTDTVVANYTGFVFPDGIAYLPSQQELAVSNLGNASVSVLWPPAGHIVGNVTVGADPRGISDVAFQGTPTPIVASYDTANISILGSAAGSVASVVRLSQTPAGIAYDDLPGQHQLYVAESLDEGTLSVINDTNNNFNPDGLTSNVPVGRDPVGVVFDPTDDEAFVSNSGSNSVSVVSGSSNTVVATIPVGSDPWGLAWDGVDHEVWVTNSVSANVSVIDTYTNSVVHTINLSADTSPEGIAYDSSTGFLYVTEGNAQDVALLDAADDRWAGNVSSGLGGTQAVFDPMDSLVYTSNQDSNNVTAFAQTTPTNSHVVANITVPNEPSGLAYDPATDEVYVSEYTGDMVDVIQPSSESVQANFTVGSYPTAMAVDTGHQTLYINNDLGGTTSIAAIPALPPTPTQEFDESGLPSGATWYVNISGQAPQLTTINGGAGTTITVSLSAASYTYSAATNWKNWTTSSGGAFTVNATANPPISVTFTAVTFPVYANETGLPVGASWYFNVTGEPSQLATVTALGGNSTVIDLQNGSYPWTIATNWKNYTTSNPSGTLTVSGGPTSVAAQYSTPITTPTTYQVTFSESTLPTGFRWYVNVSDAGGRVAGESVASGESIAIDLANGSYTFAASTNDALWAWNSTASGTGFSVAGRPLSVPVTFQTPATSPPPATFEVVFSETGLPNGDNFDVFINDIPLSAVAPASTVSIALVNGSYPYYVNSDPPYESNVTSATVNVAGHPVSVAISFSSTSSPKSTASTPSFPWIWVALAAGVIVAALLVFLILARRRRKKDEPPSSRGSGESPIDPNDPPPATDPPPY